MPEAAATAPNGPVRPRVLLFYDYACPFCYVDQFRFERLAREHDVEIVPVAERQLNVPPFELLKRVRLPAVRLSIRSVTNGCPQARRQVLRQDRVALTDHHL